MLGNIELDNFNSIKVRLEPIFPMSNTFIIIISIP